MEPDAGEQATVGDVSPDRFGRAMPLIDPGNPGNSYLLYKLLANPLNHRRSSRGVLADPEGGFEEPALGLEIDRLRDSVVVGLPMPATTSADPTSLVNPEDDPFGEASLGTMRLIQAWIANGAVLSCEEAP